MLWDRLDFDGAPREFAWVLPVRPGAWLELSSDAWFEALGAESAVRIARPRTECGMQPDEPAPGCSPSFVCNPSETPGYGTTHFDWGPGTTTAGAIAVLRREEVGPYETVTLRGHAPGAVAAWLRDDGFAVADAAIPVLDAYAAEGFDFIALRLRADRAVAAMRPVRVISPRGAPVLPLRMIGAGAAERVAVTLYVIADARWETEGAPTSAIDPASLAWQGDAGQASYDALRTEALGRDGGRGWLVSFAERGALLAPLFEPGTGTRRTFAMADGFQASTIAEGYVHAGLANGEAGTTSCLDALGRAATSRDRVVDTCANGGSCGGAPAGTIDARDLACGDLRDVAVALTGQRPHDVWVTRLEADLARDALDRDVTLHPAADQSPVDSWIVPTTVADLPCFSESSILGRWLRAPGILAFLLVTALVGWARRAGRRGRAARRRIARADRAPPTADAERGTR